jgi:anti-anti-sigma factor
VTTSAEIAVERTGDTVVARLTGEVDMTNAGYIGDELTRAVPNEALGLVVDLTGTRYLDSAAVELLFELARRLARRRQQLSLALPDSSPLRRVLLLTDVQSAAPIHETVEEALAQAQAG